MKTNFFYASLLIIIVLMLGCSQNKRPETIEHIPNFYKVVYVKGGEYMMGGGHQYSSKPIHPVKLNSFYIGKYEVTQA